LGPTLPAFLSPAVAKILVEKFDIKPIGEAKKDIEEMMQGR
jgi:hydroxylamine reductase